MAQLATLIRGVQTGGTLPMVIRAISTIWQALSGRFGLPGLDLSDTLDAAKNMAGMFTSTFTNTGGGGAQVKISGGSGGDGVLTFGQGGTDQWSIGTDQSDSNAFVLTRGGALGGANNAYRADPTTRDVVFLQNFGFRSGTGVAIMFDHAATVGRIHACQDFDGIIALLGANVLNGGPLLFDDNKWDIGATTPANARPRDLILSRNLSMGGSLAALTGAVTCLNLDVTGVAQVGTQQIGLVPQQVALGASFNLPGAWANSGLVLNIPAPAVPSQWCVIAIVCDMICQGSAADGALQGRIAITSGSGTIANPSGSAVFTATAVGQRATVAQYYAVQYTSAITVALQGQKSGSGGTSQMIATVTNMTAWY